MAAQRETAPGVRAFDGCAARPCREAVCAVGAARLLSRLRPSPLRNGQGETVRA